MFRTPKIKLRKSDILPFLHSLKLQVLVSLHTHKPLMSKQLFVSIKYKLIYWSSSPVQSTQSTATCLISTYNIHANLTQYLKTESCQKKILSTGFTLKTIMFGTVIRLSAAALVCCVQEQFPVWVTHVLKGTSSGLCRLNAKFNGNVKSECETRTYCSVYPFAAFSLIIPNSFIYFANRLAGNANAAVCHQTTAWVRPESHCLSNTVTHFHSNQDTGESADVEDDI